MPEATRLRSTNQVQLTTASAIAAAAVIQLPDGRFGYNRGRSGSTGARINFEAGDIAQVPKASGVTFLPGGRVYWDRTNRVATYKRVDTRAAYMGRAAAGAASADTLLDVEFNVDPPYDIDLLRDAFDTAIVGTQSLGGLGLYHRGGLVLKLDSTVEAQKVDALSVGRFSIDGKAIIDGTFRVLSSATGAAAVASLGIASGTHASDADEIANSAFIHLDGDDGDIHAECDDGSHEVAATDTTANYTSGSGWSVRKEFWIDMRTKSALAFYVDGVRVLSGTTFNMSSVAAELALLVHLRKSSSNAAMEVAIDSLTMRGAEQ